MSYEIQKMKIKYSRLMEELSLPISFSHFFVKLKGEFEIRKYELYNET